MIVPMSEMTMTGMRWTLALCAACAGAAGAAVTSPAAPHQAELRKIADRVYQFTVVVRARTAVAAATDDGSTELHPVQSIASGVLLGNGLAITDFAAVTLTGDDGEAQAAEEIDVVIPDLGIVPAQIAGADRALGVAILRLPERTRGLAGPATTEDLPQPGEAMIAVGANGAQLAALAVVVENTGDRIETVDPLPPAFSGGALFDASGRLAGINTLTRGQHARAVPMAALRPLTAKALGH